MYISGAILTFIGGVVLAQVGFGLTTWQYWAIAVPLVVGTVLMGASK